MKRPPKQPPELTEWLRVLNIYELTAYGGHPYEGTLASRDRCFEDAKAGGKIAIALVTILSKRKLKK